MLTGDTPFYKEGMEQMDLFRAIVKGRFTPPTNVSPEANSMIKAFLNRDPAQRLGSLAGGEDDIALHPWFKDIDFEELQHKNINPPKVPKVKDPLDASNFEDWSHLDDKSKMKFPKLTVAQKEVFLVSRQCQHFVIAHGNQWAEFSIVIKHRFSNCLLFCLLEILNVFVSPCVSVCDQVIYIRLCVDKINQN